MLFKEDDSIEEYVTSGREYVPEDSAEIEEIYEE